MAIQAWNMRVNKKCANKQSQKTLTVLRASDQGKVGFGGEHNPPKSFKTTTA